MKRATAIKIIGEFYKFSAKNPKITGRGLIGKTTKVDKEKFRSWKRKIAKKYGVSYSEISKILVD